jgi:Fic/DOC family
MNLKELKFINESNRIEGIIREATNGEITEYVRFMELECVRVEDMEHFVKIYQSNAKLRDKVGLNVRVGNHFPPYGSPEIKHKLEDLLKRACVMPENAYRHHLEYETLHPFTDGNGRSGRMLWAWQMSQIGYDFEIGFLHKFYYQTLSNR